MWQTLGDEPLRVWSWEGDYVVYSPYSGQTHRLDIVAGHLIEILIDGPKESSELFQQLSDFLEEQDSENFRSSILDVLQSLDELGLIRDIPNAS